MTEAGNAGAPVSTYRFQVRPGFGYAEVAAQADYLAALGVTHAYLSPILQAVPGSAHGYDVIDHTALSEEAGGRPAFDAMVETLHAAGLKVVVDVVPNHMAVPTPEWRNAPLWEVLRDGPTSPRAKWFDVDWESGDSRLLVPVLGGTLEEALEQGELVVATDGGPEKDQTVVRYYEHELPVLPGTEDLPWGELLPAQHWRLTPWQAGTARLDYRRFFDVTSLIAIRVEDPEVFEASHALLGELVADGSIDGLRIDHPDGLADPRGYLRRLDALTGGAWTVVEKILEGDEALPTDWPCAGTTGYDLLWRVMGVFVDPTGEVPLTDQLALVSGARTTAEATITQSKHEVVAELLVAEVLRLVRSLTAVLSTPAPDALQRVLSALLVVADRYRAYVVPGEPAPQESVELLAAWADAARAHLSEEDHPVLADVVDVLAGRGPIDAEPTALADVVVRFQQTCGPVMAKGIEDTAFYRYHRLTALNEVGGDPAHFAVSPDELFAHVERTALAWPSTMTTLSTHDTKRSEDVRARLVTLSERHGAWEKWLRTAQELARPVRSETLDGATEYLLWQTLVSTWPISEERLQAYAQKAIREAGVHTSWTAPDEEYEQAVEAFVTGVVSDPQLVTHLEAWVADAAPLTRVVTLGQKLLQLVLPGVPDVYQGTELVDLSLVDPDNRREVDFADRAERLARLDAGSSPQDLADEKLLVTSRALRLRRDHPEWFATSAGVPSQNQHVVTVARGDASGVRVVAVSRRLLGSLTPGGADLVDVPPGAWLDVLTGTSYESEGQLSAGELLDALPVALLVADGQG